MRDEIIEEVRRIRNRYVRRHGGDVDAIYADLKKREKASSRRIVDLAAMRKKPSRGNVTPKS